VPQHPAGTHLIEQEGGASGEGLAAGVIFLFLPAGADTQLEPAIGQAVERRRLLRQQERNGAISTLVIRSTDFVAPAAAANTVIGSGQLSDGSTAQPPQG
jgi:hypothetical protein